MDNSQEIDKLFTTDFPEKPLSLCFLGDEVLRKKCDPVTNFSDKLNKFMNNMHKAMKKFGGIGLAAPQIGVSLRAIVVEINKRVILLPNPEIISCSDDIICEEEGCLSIPGQVFSVERTGFIEIKARTVTGGRIHFEADGLFARALQHEIDHLDGVLICDKEK
ncbi:MAG TPA: peptide deformylase [Chitinispirillaceae bacterium]|nr:peptide deformylase [Chitinispirillaceae bacterium]